MKLKQLIQQENANIYLEDSQGFTALNLGKINILMNHTVYIYIYL